MKFDYRMDGNDQIICVTTDGVVRGYTVQNQSKAKNDALGNNNLEKMLETYNDLLKTKKVLNIIKY